MLKKIAGLALVNKLRAILLMEADFNFHNKLVFSSRILIAVRTNGLIPLEQYSKQQSTADDGSFDKVLQGDISRQRWLPMSIVSVDAANCYNRIHHAIMTTIFLCIDIQTEAIAAMLYPIQLMKFFSPDRMGRVNQIHWRQSGSKSSMACVKVMVQHQLGGSPSVRFW